jgi:hypothetical protein
MNAIKPVFRDLASENLLKRCLYGKTHNPNENMNFVIWARIPKTVVVGLHTLKFGVYGAALCFNDGIAEKECCPKHTGCEMWLKQSKCSEEDKSGKDLSGRNNNTDITREARRKQRTQKRRSARSK